MFRAVFNDLIQRILTCNKREQRASLGRVFQGIKYLPGAKILDFGCGTGLFAKIFIQKGFKYCGYDVDKRLVKYGRLLHPSSLFMYRKKDVSNNGPYDYVLSNCCFHHISDKQLNDELEFIYSILKHDGHFVMVDILAQGQEESSLHRLYMMIEQGNYIRFHGAYLRLLQLKYDILHMEVERSHFFSIRGIPLYNDLGIYVCQPHH